MNSRPVPAQASTDPPAVSATEMAAVDALAVARGLTLLQMMENAGHVGPAYSARHGSTGSAGVAGRLACCGSRSTPVPRLQPAMICVTRLAGRSISRAASDAQSAAGCRRLAR